ncbi:MAG: glycerol-3-phosphate 1-O-acyltransferase PlsY [Verrucomicrobiota bacterium]
MATLSYIAVIGAAYLLGSIPTGYLAAKARGIDIRTVGSGNIGATNAFRVLGKGFGVLVLVVDGLKGYTACAWLCDLLGGLLGVTGPDLELHRVLAGIAVVLGHNYTCWLGFKGGKGIATSAGAYFALAPLAAGIAVAAWLIALAATRFVSVASIASAIALPAAVWCTQRSILLGCVTSALGVLAIAKHRGNIRRLLQGTEPRLGRRKEVAS